MASITTWAANTVICAGCRSAIIPNTKPDGGIIFGAPLVHSVKPTKKRDLCAKYGYAVVAPAAPVAAPGPKLTAQEKRLARMLRSNDRLTAQREADRKRAEKFAAEGHDFGPPEPTEEEVYRHRSKLQPGEDCIDERCFYCGSPNHWSKDCLTI